MKLQRLGSADQEADSEHQLCAAVAAIKTAEEARTFFEDLCTPAELQAMADRWRVVPLLKAGKTYRQIYDETGVSVTTIGRVARCILLGSGGYNVIYERLKRAKYETKIKNSHTKKWTSEQ